ncbi:MAG: leucine-rich repeat domain-containing protein [Prevotella sp.]|nr:leucine-rich repeat domain-containing protein [Prevotella sp.]
MEHPYLNLTLDGKTLFSLKIKIKEKIQEVVIPKSVTTIRERAFEDCKKLQSIIIPDSVTTIGWSAFRGCIALKSIDIPDFVAEIEESAFENCIALQSINIPDSVTAIGESAFEGCSALKSINIPDSVTAIRNAAFRGCSALQKICFRYKDPDDILYLLFGGLECDLNEANLYLFDESIFETCTLFVPPGTRWKYRHHPFFAQFKKIEIIH